MRNYVVIILCIVVLKANAQPSEATKTIVGKGNVHIGYFISPSCQFGKIVGSNAIVPSFGAGVIVNHNLYLGLTYRYIANENTPVGELDKRLYLDEKWVGIRCEYSLRPEKVIYLNFSMETGISHIELDLKDSYEGSGVIVPTDDSNFGYIDPGLAIELNVWKYIRLNFGVGYRFASNVSFRNISEKDLTGATYHAALKIGLF